jgi:hypothetical protein
MGALTFDGGKIFIGSRLTIYEAEDAWRTLHLPLLLFNIIGGPEALLGAIRRTFLGEEQQGGDSMWTERHLAQVERYLSQLCVCTTGGLGLTAEFGLREGAVSAVAGDHRTALFQLVADQPHPELGGGLFCLLQMPHQLGDARRLNQVCLQLNKMEMAAHDLPPHFGAWCPGRLGDNTAYASFLPTQPPRHAGQRWSRFPGRVVTGSGERVPGRDSASIAAGIALKRRCHDDTFRSSKPGRRDRLVLPGRSDRMCHQHSSGT